LRLGTGAAAGLLIGGGHTTARATPARQESGFIQGGRWNEAEGFGLGQRADPTSYISFATEFPFHALAPSWSGEGDPGAVVELLWSPDGVTWSEPLWIGKATHIGGPPDRDGRHIGTLTSTPGGTFLQYRTYDGAGNLAALPGFELDYIDASTGATLAQVAAPATTPVFSPPPIVSRAAWGADESLRYNRNGNEIFPVTYQPVEHVVIHHADTANFNDPVLEMRSIYYFHAITRGWGDIAYNYLIDFMGNVYEGRVGGESAVGCHAEGYNAGSCGVCLMGRFFEDDITPEMHNAAVWIASWAARDLNPTSFAPFHDIPELPTICGHRDVNNTTCPGEDFYRQLELVRSEAQRVISGRDTPEVPPPQWYPGMLVVANTEGTILRKGPGVEFDAMAEVAQGERLQVLEGPTTNERTIWYEAQGMSMTGWIAGNLLSPDPNQEPWEPLPAAPPSTPPPATAEPPPTEEPPPGQGGVGGGDDGGGGRRNRRRRDQRQDAWPILEHGMVTMVIDGALNLRVEPSLWAAILTELPDGSVVTVIDGPVESDGIDWYQILTPEDTVGWCDGLYLQPI
jgi:uncharacterized protein YgiM (DUF1202 family)